MTTVAANSGSDDEDGQPRRRELRSFVRREGRFTPAQQRALRTLWSHYGVDYSGQPRDLDALFGRRAPRVLEIGFGNGEALLHAAVLQPECDLLGIEVYRPGVGRALNALAAQGIGNVRICCHDAVEVLRHEIVNASLDEVRIYFPDPWPKKRHHKRRLIQPSFVQLLAERLRPGGRLHLATDWPSYAEHMRAVLAAEPAFAPALGTDPVIARPHWRPQTRFELRGRERGHPVCDLLYARLPIPC